MFHVPLFLVLILSVSAILAQTSQVRGELRDATGPVDRLTVYLTSVEHRSPVDKAFVSSNGLFQFQSIAQGTYVLEVRTVDGDVLTQHMLTVAGGPVETSISLGKSAPAASVQIPAGPQTVSVNQLRHDPDGRATREFLVGEQALLKNNLAGARKHFLKAIKIDPDYPEAYTELGTAAFRSGQLDAAKQNFERAVELDRKQTIAWGNLASLLYQKQEFGQAEAVARRGLEAAPSSAKLHFLAGASRMALGHYAGGTAQHLEQASNDFPNARVLLAETLLRLGDAIRAKPHLEASLVSTNAQVRARAMLLMDRAGLSSSPTSSR